MYLYQFQPYKTWKGYSTNSLVPGNSRGGVNGVSDCACDYIGPDFKARPIKHYRKQLIPNNKSGTSKASIKDAMETPGGAVYLGTNKTRTNGRTKCECCKTGQVYPNSSACVRDCCNHDMSSENCIGNPNMLEKTVNKSSVKSRFVIDDNGSNLQQDTEQTTNTKTDCNTSHGNTSCCNYKNCCEQMNFTNKRTTIKNPTIEKCNDFYITECDKYFDSESAAISNWQICNAENKPVCVSCNPENNIIKSAVSLLNKKYYSDTRGYLQSRSLTYQQKLSINPVKDKSNYFSKDGGALWPSECNPSTGCPQPQTFNTSDCSKQCNIIDVSCCEITCTEPRVKTIYKPSNRKFSTQGAVSSSNRLLRLKVDTITQNGNSFRSAIGEAAANAGRYRGNNSGPYFAKTKFDVGFKNKRKNGTYQKKYNQTFSRVNGNKNMWSGNKAYPRRPCSTLACM